MKTEFRVLFLCTHNSARSIMAECAINRLGKGKFVGLSAGSDPLTQINPFVLELLKEMGYETGGLRSKSWDEFEKPDSPELDFVITVCDTVKGEVCPVWFGQPIKGHWGAPDPATFVGTDEQKRQFFFHVYTELETRIKLFTSLPVETLDRFALEQRVKEIGSRKLSDHS